MNRHILLIILSLCLIVESKIKKGPFLQFQEFMKKYNKHYNSIEELMTRYKIFTENLNRSSKSKGRWQEGITKFFDLSPEEFRRTYRNYKRDPEIRKNIETIDISTLNMEDPPENFNWVDKGVVPPIKDQKQCGSCWAFSCCGNLESQYKMKHGNWETCSEQMMVDCMESAFGCDGGDEVMAAEWVEWYGGIETEETYPYTAEEEEECKAKKENYRIQVEKVIRMKGTNEDDMVNFLVTYGPSMIAMNSEPLQNYIGGIIDVEIDECSPEDIDHALVLVGYGVLNGKKYWIVRNSWGDNWGENGYFRIVRGKGACGINLELATAFVK